MTSEVRNKLATMYIHTKKEKVEAVVLLSPGSLYAALPAATSDPGSANGLMELVSMAW